MPFPDRRMRRLRQTAAMRELVAESELRASDLVAPLFVREDILEPAPIASLPGVVQHSRESVIKEARELVEAGVKGVILFGVPSKKDPTGSEAWNDNGILCSALRDVRSEVGDELVVMADVCLDEYTDHGHCGPLTDKGSVDNDAAVASYARIAVAQARSGAHVVAPSGMMDGQVGGIRASLDEAGFEEVAILAYGAKYASALYGPFRDAVDVRIACGDRKSYQQDYRNRREALREVLLDIDEGADMIMVKPATSYLDVIADVAAVVDVPVAAYHVSGEYAMVKAAAERGWIDGAAVAFEQLTSIKRAGADIILTYFAKEMAEALHG